MAERITVMHLRDSNFLGGPEKQILEHLARVDREVFAPLLCSFAGDGASSDLFAAGEKLGVPAFTISGCCKFSPGHVRQLRKLLLAHRVDVLVTHGYKPNIVGFLAGQGLPVRLLAYSHGWTAEDLRVRLYEKLDRIVMRRFAAVVAVSEGHKKELLRAGVRQERITVIRNAVSLTGRSTGELRKRYGLPEKAFVVVSAGRLSPEKDFVGLIEAAAPILKKRADLFFVVLGEGKERGVLEKLIRAKGIEGRFLLPGFVADVPAVLADADLFVSSSRTEGLPVAVLEGAGCGLPVVATAVGGTPEVVKEGHSGLLVPAGDVVALRNAIERLVDDRPLAKVMGEHGAVLVRTLFNFEGHCRSLEALYRRISENDA